MDRERTDFFDTRVTGRTEIWQTLRAALEIMGSGGDTEDVDGGMATAQQILDAAAITLPTGDLANGAYDGFGAYYPMPEHIVADPANMAYAPLGIDDDDKGAGCEEPDEEELLKRREEKGKGVLSADDLTTVKARLSDGGGPDLVVSIGKNDSVRSLARRLLEESGVSSTYHMSGHEANDV